MIGGHNLFDALRAEDLKAWGPLWAILHTGEDIALTSSLAIDPFYPLVPWVGVMVLGYALGPMIEKGAPRVRRLPHGGICEALNSPAVLGYRPNRPKLHSLPSRTQTRSATERGIGLLVTASHA